MHRRHRPGVARVQRLKHVERLRSPHLADDDAVGPHAGALRTSWRMVTSPPLDVRRPALEAQHVGCWSRNSAASSIVMIRSARSTNEDSTLSRVVLPDPVPHDDDVASALDALAQEGRCVGRHGCVVDQVLEAERATPEPPDRQQRAVEAQRRNHAVDPRPVRQARIGQRRRLVDAAAERTQDALDQMHQLLVRAERHIRLDDATAALDMHCARPLTMISSTAGSSISGSSGPSPMVPDTTPVHEGGPLAVVERQRLFGQQGSDAAAQNARVGRGNLEARLLDKAPPQDTCDVVDRAQLPSPDAAIDTGPSRRVSPAARGTTRTSRAKLSAAVNSTAWRNVARSVTRPSAARLHRRADPTPPDSNPTTGIR